MSETKSGGKIVYHSENFRFDSEFFLKYELKLKIIKKFVLIKVQIKKTNVFFL